MKDIKEKTKRFHNYVWDSNFVTLNLNGTFEQKPKGQIWIAAQRDV